MSTPPRPAPARTPSYLYFVPRRSPAALRASYDNLVALANAQERLRGTVWRDRGEPVTELESVDECVLHAARGGLRAGILAFNIRAGMNLFLLLFRIRRIPKDKRFAMIRHALLGPDSVRFGAMLGMFVSIYKLILNALPLLFPSTAPLPPPAAVLSPTMTSSPQSHTSELEPTSPTSLRRPRLALSASAQNATIRKRARRWHAALAGAVAGGAAVLCERRDRRLGIGQQLFVRGLQGSWNALAERRGWHVPHGAIWLFSICCGQIMYATLMRPDTLHHSYVDWIVRASHAPPDAVTLNRQLIGKGSFDPALARRVAARPNTTPRNYGLLTQMADAASATPPAYGVPISPCHGIHNWRDSCTVTGVERIWQVATWMAPVYGALHLIPAVLFRQKAFVKAPLQVLLRALAGTARSSAFLGVFVAIYQSSMCAKGNLWLLLGALRARAAKASAPAVASALARAQAVLAHRFSFWLFGLFAGSAIALEEARRRPELALYVLPKALESAWAVARGRGYVVPLGRAGDVLLAALGCGGLMGTYQNDPAHLGGLVRRVVYQFVGPN